MIDFKNFNLEKLKRYTSAQAVNDFDKFLDDLPVNVGINNLTTVLVMWAIAAVAVFFAIEQSDKLLSIHQKLNEVNALRPPVPTLEYRAVEKAELDKFTETLTEIFKGIRINTRQGGVVAINAQDTDFYPQFIASISYLQRGARNWKVNITDLCVGRECTGSQLRATLTVEQVRVRPPAN